MLGLLKRFFAPQPSVPVTEPREAYVVRYWLWRITIFLATTIGYGFYYFIREGLSVAKTTMIDQGVATAAMLGTFGLAHKFVYAMGKTTNGFLADHTNPQRLFSVALFCSAICAIGFGSSSLTFLLLGFWAINGWFQSYGVPCSAVSLSAWFSAKHLGTAYAIWGLAHHIGEWAAFVISARIIDAQGGSPGAWRWAFWTPGAACLVMAGVLYVVMSDRPESRGLPGPAKFDGLASANSETEADGEKSLATIWKAQLGVLSNRWVWVCGLANASMYVCRYAIKDWGPAYLEKVRGYTMVEAADIVGETSLWGIAGTVIAGPLSDRMFRGKRVPLALIYAVLLAVGWTYFLFDSSDPRWTRIALIAVGVALGGLLVFLGGLIAMEISSRNAAGAAVGVVGGMAYVGAGIQDWLSGVYLRIEGKGEAAVYDFSTVTPFWCAAAWICVLLTALMWSAELRGDPDAQERTAE